MENTAIPRLTSAHALAAELDALLGDPRQPGGPFSYLEIIKHEERDSLPPGAVERIREWGMQQFLVPVAYGGRLRSLEELFELTRVLSRRNLTIAVMFGSALLGANPVWLWGSDAQRERLAEAMLSGVLTCFGVSEANNGSDLRSTETTACHDGDELVLSGTKWLVGNATRARFVTAFCRMDGDPRFSLVLVDKEQLDPGTWSNLPPIRTVGLRGHDLSGIEFREARLPGSAVIGREGIGLVQTLKALQITRTCIAALSLGSMDAAIRMALQYAGERFLYGKPIYKIPIIRDHLIKSHLDLLIGECVAVPVTRSLSVSPGRLSLWSSVVKYFVPVLAEETIASMGTVLGARSYLREGVANGVFQKVQRDHAIASIFEGTTHVNLHAIADQLPFVLARQAEGSSAGAEARANLVKILFCLTEDSPTWCADGSLLQLTNEGLDEITGSWDDIRHHLSALPPASAAPTVVSSVLGLLDEFSALREHSYGKLAGRESADSGSVVFMSIAKQHAIFHAAASILLMWRFNREQLGGEFADGGWVVLCLERLLQRLEPSRELSDEYLPSIEKVILRCLEKDVTFNLRTLADG